MSQPGGGGKRQRPPQLWDMRAASLDTGLRFRPCSGMPNKLALTCGTFPQLPVRGSHAVLVGLGPASGLLSSSGSGGPGRCTGEALTPAGRDVMTAGICLPFPKLYRTREAKLGTLEVFPLRITCSGIPNSWYLTVGSDFGPLDNFNQRPGIRIRIRQDPPLHILENFAASRVSVNVTRRWAEIAQGRAQHTPKARPSPPLYPSPDTGESLGSLRRDKAFLRGQEIKSTPSGLTNHGTHSLHMNTYVSFSKHFYAKQCAYFFLS